MVTGTVTPVRPLLIEKGQAITVDVRELLTEGEPRWLEQLAVNLLANAHRSTPAGTRLTVTDRTTAQAIELTISDTGPGIPSDRLEAVFQRVHRLSRRGNGSGLGLTIACEILAVHGGWI